MCSVRACTSVCLWRIESEHSMPPSLWKRCSRVEPLSVCVCVQCSIPHLQRACRREKIWRSSKTTLFPPTTCVCVCVCRCTRVCVCCSRSSTVAPASPPCTFLHVTPSRRLLHTTPLITVAHQSARQLAGTRVHAKWHYYLPFAHTGSSFSEPDAQQVNSVHTHGRSSKASAPKVRPVCVALHWLWCHTAFHCACMRACV